MAAACNGHLEVVEYLTARGADLNIEDRVRLGEFRIGFLSYSEL